VSDAPGDSLLVTIRKLIGPSPAEGAGDGELLRRFVQLRDEAAFELLVWRHAGLVLSVCRQVLRHEQAVEDAFQAAFLVLARKAASISRREAIAGWLHRVAFRVAVRARQVAARCPVPASLEVNLAALPAPACSGANEDEVRLLHEEILRLPEKYRLPVICCYLEGRTHAEAAEELGWCKGTVAGRLARARELLRRRLARRGVDAAAVPVLIQGLASSAETTGWAGRIAGLVKVLAGVEITSGGELSAPAVALAEGVIEEMFRAKLKWAVLVVLSLVVVGLGTVLAKTIPIGGEQPGTGEQRSKEDTEAERPAAPAEKADDPFYEALQRARVRQQLRTIGKALLNYHAAYGHLPPPAILDKSGKPVLSWRVALLPFLERDALYQQFKLDEPWDSAHNKKLLASMPAVYAPVNKMSGATSTYFQYIVGQDAIFISHRLPGVPASGPGGPGSGAGLPGPRGGGSAAGPPPVGGGAGSGGGLAGPGGSAGGPPPGFGGSGGPAGGAPGGLGMRGPTLPSIPSSIPDGTANTILVVEGGIAVPWTKPDDVLYDPKGRLPRLGGQFASYIHALTVDGTARTLPRRIDERTLRAAITPAGGEPIDMDRISAIPGAAVREGAMKLLQDRNSRLKGEVNLLKDTLSELKEEVESLRWAVEAELLMKLDPKAAALQAENSRLEKTMREARDEARQLAVEIKRLKEELRKRQKK
jgi:RNA polymerase sigma factor (sigma-70 family)